MKRYFKNYRYHINESITEDEFQDLIDNATDEQYEQFVKDNSPYEVWNAGDPVFDDFAIDYIKSNGAVAFAQLLNSERIREEDDVIVYNKNTDKIYKSSEDTIEDAYNELGYKICTEQGIENLDISALQ